MIELFSPIACFITIIKQLKRKDMFCETSNKKETTVDRELKKLKRKDRRRDGLLIILALQLTSLGLIYYLGRTHNKKRDK